MKRVFSLLLSVMLLIGVSSVAYADDQAVQVEYLSDGSYIVSVVENTTSDIAPFSTTTTKSKRSTYYSASDEAQWYVMVTGKFTYGDGYAKCTSSSVSTKVYNTKNWKITHKASTYYRNQASASVTVNQLRDNGSVVQTMYRTVTLTCSADGTFS